jgi:hypothetical protein
MQTMAWVVARTEAVFQNANFMLMSLYQKFDFWPRFLTAIMSKEVTQLGNNETSNLKWSRYSEEVSEGTHKDEKHLLEECNKLTNSVYEGLNLETEIRSVKKQNLGDTILVGDEEIVTKMIVMMKISH